MIRLCVIIRMKKKLKIHYLKKRTIINIIINVANTSSHKNLE